MNSHQFNTNTNNCKATKRKRRLLSYFNHFSFCLANNHFFSRSDTEMIRAYTVLWKHSSHLKTTLITPAPVCANMIQIFVHTCRGLGCSIFVEINVKRQSNPSPLKVFNIQHCLTHTYSLFSQAQLFQNIISKSVCLLGTTAGLIRVVSPVMYCSTVLYL